MANRKVYKKKQDNFLRNALIVFGSIFMVLTVVFIVSSMNELKYDDFEHLQTYEEFDNKPEQKYAVYLYSEECGYCIQIKNKLLNFADSNESDLKVYFIDIYSVSGNSTVLPSQVTGTPSLIVIEDGNVVDVFGGSEDIPAFIDDINNGEYTFGE
jgi:thiol-disulfide isomerase/thioredoxin